MVWLKMLFNMALCNLMKRNGSLLNVSQKQVVGLILQMSEMMCVCSLQLTAYVVIVVTSQDSYVLLS